MDKLMEKPSCVHRDKKNHKVCPGLLQGIARYQRMVGSVQENSIVS